MGRMARLMFPAPNRIASALLPPCPLVYDDDMPLEEANGVAQNRQPRSFTVKTVSLVRFRTIIGM